jgi:hypothetical protein
MPVVFPPAMKLLERFVRDHGCIAKVAYYDSRYRRDTAPLLDHLACVIDHVEAFSTGGEDVDSNYATACNKCNVRKNAARADTFQHRHPPKRIRAKYGEPTAWDGFSSLFLVLGQRYRSELTASEAEWLRALAKVSRG